jgi:hypothetical protein
MLIEQSAATKRKHQSKVSKWIWIPAVVLLGLIATGIVLLATHWPFTRDAVTRALQEAAGRPVQFRTFSNSYFPPGCTVGGIRFLHSDDPQAPPLITVERLEVQGSLTGMFSSPKRLATVRVIGMRLRLAAKKPGTTVRLVPLNSGQGGKSLAISKITADGALLEFLKADGKTPYRLSIDRLAITNVGSGQPMYYRATLTNTEPPGVIRSEGKFGPWNPQDVGATQVSGAYTYDDINLGAFHGVRGVGHARGKFEGPLSRIRTAGNVEVAGFEVDGSGHKVALSTTYDATVNGTNGDVLLNPAVARYRHTEVEVRGWIAGGKGDHGKTAQFDVAVPKGRVDDLLYLFSQGQPGLAGEVGLRGKFTWPPGPRKFVEKIRMELTFGMNGSHFTKANTQDSINRISESAQGEKKKEQDEDTRTVVSEIRGSILLRDGVATVTHANFQVPGAQAAVHGTYDLRDKRVDLHGTLDTQGKLSDTTSGFKALVLKAVTPLMKKKDSVRIVPFQITGAYGSTNVGIDWKKNLAGK